LRIAASRPAGLELEIRKDFEAAACDPEFPLYGLVGIRNAAHREHLRIPPRRSQPFAQKPRSVLLHQDLALEVKPRREAEVLVCRTGIAIVADYAVGDKISRACGDVEELRDAEWLDRRHMQVGAALYRGSFYVPFP
jgi:hypothetical protein